MPSNKTPLVTVLLLMLALPAFADDKVDFEKQIQPILETHCNKCHGEKIREGGLRFTNRHDALLETDSSEYAIVPGKPDQSGLIARIKSHDESDMMPPEGARLSKEQIGLLQKWIEEGAVWPESSTKKHWAYLAPIRPELPEVSNNEWLVNPIDNFVLSKLETNSRKPSPKSDPARLIRRVSLALTGLPPTLKQVDEFLDDPSESAYEKFVDQCLDSKAFGERWAQPWLDLARFADSNGFQADQLRESWAYRDWVINSMNADMPFDQFTIEQLAGDLLPDATLDQKIATGFHRTVTCNVEAGVHPEENRINQIFDRVNTTGTVFLGTTIECCQCHNHKYDPFTQDEYYRLFAYFNNTPVEVKLQSGVQYNFDGPYIELPLDGLKKIKLETLKARLAELEAEHKRVVKRSSNERKKLRSELAEAISTSSQWEPLEISLVSTAGGEDHEILGDQSVLFGGSLPSTANYKIKAFSKLSKITAFRVDALTHDSLPGKGPGRGDEKRTNFILSEFDVEARIQSAESPAYDPIELANAAADFSQKGWDVKKAIDGDGKTGWAIAPEFSKGHWARFELSEPFKTENAKTEFRFTLDQNYGRGRVLGRVRISATNAPPKVLSLPDDIREILSHKDLNENQTQKLDVFLDSFNPRKLELDKEIGAIKKEIEKIKPSTSLVMVEMDQMRDTFKFSRGDYLSPGKKVEPGVPAVLHPLDETLPKNRLGLAKWLVDPANPLLARVAVNRWWTNLFGHGIVKSGEDFGTQSEPASHPELLDWLSAEFIESGFSRKHVLKLIVMSSTFRQSAKLSADLLENDPKNELYNRGPRFRMPAEMIRDHGLAVSGLLSRKMGGPPVMPFQPENIWRAVGRNAPKWNAADNEDRFRRGVYVIWRRAAPYPSFVNFDAPDRASCVVERPRTNTPLQALTLLNDRAYLEMAVALAKQVDEKLSGKTVQEKIELAMRRCIIRKPTESEVSTLYELYQSERKRFLANPQLSKQFLKENSSTDAASVDQPDDLAALSIVTNVLLNLDETINY